MFTINGRTWRIVAVPSNSYKLIRPDGSISVAACENETNTIYLNHLLRGSFLRKVLCHEITHAAMFSYHVSLTLEQEELLADLLATYGDEIIAITNQVFSRLTYKGEGLSG